MKARYAWENYQRAILAFSSIILTFLAFILLIIAGATPGWTRITYKDPKGVAEEGVLASFGLFRGEHQVDSGFSDISREEDFEVDDYLGNELPIWRLDLTFALIVVSFFLCMPAMAVTFLSTYQTVTTIWKGPAVAYLLNVAAAFFAFFALGVYLDFFLWDVGNGEELLQAKRPDLSIRLFNTDAILWYSFVIHCVACGLLLASILLCWRLMVILPSFAGPVSVYKSEVSLDVVGKTTTMQTHQMQQVQQFVPYTVPFEKQSVAAASYEESSVLY